MHFRAVFTAAMARFAMALVFVGVLGAGAAQAQNVLMLATTESQADGVDALSNLQAEFVGAGATVVRQNILSSPGAVTAATFSASPGPYDIVLVATVYNPVHASNWNAIDAAIASRAANSFVMFVDGCCETAANIARMRTGLAAASGFALSVGANQAAIGFFPLNTNSLYQGFFAAGLPQIRGGYTQYIAGVPTANALYLPEGTVTMPAVGSTTQAYGLFLPITQSYVGAGACVFAVNDISPFSTNAAGVNIYASNQGKIAAAFLGAAGPGGACGLAASVSKAFSPTAVVSGQNATLTIQVANHSNPLVDVAALNVVDQLPAPLLVNGAAVSTCTGGTLSAANGSDTVSLTGATLPAAGCNITVPVIWPASAASQCVNTSTTVTNTIAPGSVANGGQFSTAGGQVNTPAQATLTCAEVVLPASVSKSFAPATVVSGQGATLTIQMTNHTTTGMAVGALNVLDQLPAPLLVNGAAVSTCTGGTLTAVNGSAVVSLVDATLPAAGCTITVPVVWPQSAAGQCVNTSTTVTNTITPGDLANGGQFSTAVGQVDTPAQANLTCAETVVPPVNGVYPVPTLGEWARLLMAALLAVVAAALLARRQRLS